MHKSQINLDHVNFLKMDTWALDFNSLYPCVPYVEQADFDKRRVKELSEALIDDQSLDCLLCDKKGRLSFMTDKVCFHDALFLTKFLKENPVCRECLFKK